MKPDNLSEIENEIRETAALEASSAVTDLPNTVARNINLFDEKVNSTDDQVDVVIDNDTGMDVVVDDQSVVFVVNDDQTGVDIDIDVETHIDQN